jgi:hypothetical protein
MIFSLRLFHRLSAHTPDHAIPDFTQRAATSAPQWATRTR